MPSSRRYARKSSLGETALTFSASIDPYLRGVAIAALTPENEVEVEEAYFQTLALPQGFTLKGGRFFSGIGYQNEIHQHAWDFQDAPLAYKAFLGGRLRQDGVQLRWLAPTPIFLELGAELSSGDQFPGSERSPISGPGRRTSACDRAGARNLSAAARAACRLLCFGRGGLCRGAHRLRPVRPAIGRGHRVGDGDARLAIFCF